MSSTDVESLQPAPRQRGRCLDAFLLGSVITLYVMVLSGAAFGFWFFRNLPAETDSLSRAPEAIRSALKNNETLPNFHSSDKMQNFAYFSPVSSTVKNGSMEWRPISYGKNNTVGSRYSYNSNHHALTMNQEGTYFLYIQLQLSCTWVCGNGSFSITFEDEHARELLSCAVQLTFPGPSVNKCWTVIPHLPAKSRLMARMHTSVSPDTPLRLDLNHSGFGMFLVDGPGIKEETKTGQTN